MKKDRSVEFVMGDAVPPLPGLGEKLRIQPDTLITHDIIS
jgi:hypothetical protein